MAIKKNKKRGCEQSGCKEEVSMEGYCRLHYIAQWQTHKNEAKQKNEKILNQYVRVLTKKYPDSYLEVLRSDLQDAKKFEKTVADLNLGDLEDDNVLDDLEKIVKKLSKD
ncbi:MAG: hypothetical protein HY390_07130 [Deltaproteobacteria bacterium]|nr:hypothetical protein [Deltaproteobacteria bacterium]